MVDARTKTMGILFACAVVAMAANIGIKSHKILKDKAQAQDSVTQSLERWEQSYQALGASRDAWNKNYQLESSVQDVLSLMGLVNLKSYGLVTDIDNLVLTKAEQVMQNDVPIGLTKICMGTGAGDGGALQVQAYTYQALLDGISQLTKRPDIYLGNITVQGKSAVPMARLGEFCVLMRND